MSGANGANESAGSGRVPGAPVVEADDLMREAPDLVFVRACRHGATWPHRMQHYAGWLTSRSLTWPDWLPYIHPRDVAPAVAGVHIHWPGRSAEDETKVAPDQRVAVMTYSGPWTVPVRTMLRRAGWIDITDLWHAAAEARRAVLSRPEVPVVSVSELDVVVGEVVARARTRRQASTPPVGA